MTEYEKEMLAIEREKLRIARIAAYNSAVQAQNMIRLKRAQYRRDNESWLDRVFDW
jgi:hypothetical protein